MPTNMGPPPAPCAGSSKRKQLDEDELLLEADGSRRKDSIANDYKNLVSISLGNGDECEVGDEYESIIDAQQPHTISQDGDIKITPFNLDEELEEGEIDEKTGNYVFRKGSPTNEDNDDTWAESVDWAAVERRERENKSKLQQQSTIEGEKPNTRVKSEPAERDRLSCYKQLLRVMRSDETVQKAIRRLGNEVPKRRPFNNKSKAQQSIKPSGCGPADQDKVAEARKTLDLMIELAHHLLEDGDTDIYQKSYEDLEEAIN